MTLRFAAPAYPNGRHCLTETRRLNNRRKEPKMTNIGKKCIIRCYASGVHYGTLVDHDGRQVTLSDSRRLWRWNTGGTSKGVSLSSVAMTGIDASKSVVEPVLPSITLLDAIEIIPASDVAAASIEAV